MKQKYPENAVAFYQGRFSPLTKGHLKVLLWLFANFPKVVIGIGSCYEAGSAKHPILAVFREKIILWSLAQNKINPERIKIVHIPDFNDWDAWWRKILEISDNNRVTDFICGNENQILSIIAEKKLTLPFDLINPEKDLPKKYVFPYRATDLRQAVMSGNYDLFELIAAPATLHLMSHIGGFKGIREAMKNSGMEFIEGRQTVDLIVTASDRCGQKFVLCGYRDKKKANFPNRLATPGGAIKMYESPMDAAVRELKEETGVTVKILNRFLEPAHVSVNGIIADMKLVGLFSTKNPAIGGSQGGSSQVFHIDLEMGPEYFNAYISSGSDLKRVAFRPVKKVLQLGLAYQQAEMLKIALGI